MSIKRNTIIFWWVVGLIPILGIVWGLYRPDDYAASRDYYGNWVQGFGILSWLAFITLQAGQVILTPVNHYVIGVLGGFLFGPIYGGCLNWIGRVLGHLAAFFLARKFGRRVVERFISEEQVKRYDRLIGNRGAVLFLIFFLPFFPDDEVSYLVGLSKMRLRVFLPATLLGHVGGSWSLSYVGAGTESYDPFFWTLVAITVLGFPAIAYLLRRRETQNVGKGEVTESGEQSVDS